MHSNYKELWRLAEPYLNTRANDIHTPISVEYAYELLRREGGDEGIVIPAMILHDVGWKMVPEERQLEAFGPNATCPELNRIHETEGARIAAGILRQAGYDEARIREITEIVEGHDSRKRAISLNDKLVKDADKLCRYSWQGFWIDRLRFGQTVEQGVKRLNATLREWFFTDSAKEIAAQELEERVREMKKSRQ
jgi:HD superfamily phosphodiesterase